MELYPKLIDDTLEDALLVLRRVLELRNSDIAELVELQSLAGYQSGFRKATAAIAAAYSAGVNDLDIDVDTSGGSVTVTLDASPVDGQEHRVWKLISTSNTLIVDGNGKNINGAGTYTIAGAASGVVFLKYFGAAGKWRAVTL